MSAVPLARTPAEAGPPVLEVTFSTPAAREDVVAGRGDRTSERARAVAALRPAPEEAPAP